MTSGVELLRGLFLRHWSGATSYYPAWWPEVASYGQCAIIALKVQELLGGEVLGLEIPGRGSRYANRVNGEVLDLTADQLASPIDYTGARVRERPQVLSNVTTAARYRRFSEAVDSDIDVNFPAAAIEHVAIRDAR